MILNVLFPKTSFSRFPQCILRTAVKKKRKLNQNCIGKEFVPTTPPLSREREPIVSNILIVVQSFDIK